MRDRTGEKVHKTQTCWRVPVLLNRYGKDVTMYPIVTAENEDEAEAKVRAIYTDYFVSFAGIPRLVHHGNRYHHGSLDG